MNVRHLTAAVVLAGFAPAAFADAPKPAGKPVEMTLEDQFGREQGLAQLRGRVVVLVYGDRKGTDVCREYGEQLHVLFHPTAKGQPAAKARQAVVDPLPGLPAGKPSPDVLVVPVACAGSVPNLVKEMIRTQVKKASPDVPVLLDFTGAMEDKFGLRGGEPNLAVIDAAGRLRFKVNGTPDPATGDRLVQAIQNLRAEAAGVGR